MSELATPWDICENQYFIRPEEDRVNMHPSEVQMPLLLFSTTSGCVRLWPRDCVLPRQFGILVDYFSWAES